MPVTYFKVTWKGRGETEIVHGMTIEGALENAGYGPKSFSLMASHQIVSATEEETIDYLRLKYGESLAWSILNDEERARYRAEATGVLYSRHNSRPDRFPRIK